MNKVIAAAQQQQPAATAPKVLYAVQGATDPPTFTLFVNRELPPTYLRYLERSASARRSTSARRRSSCACGSARSRPMPFCEDCAKYWTPSAMNDDGTCPTCGRVVEAPKPASTITSQEPRPEEARGRRGRRPRRRQGAVALQADDGDAGRLPGLAASSTCSSDGRRCGCPGRLRQESPGSGNVVASVGQARVATSDCQPARVTVVLPGEGSITAAHQQRLTDHEPSRAAS